MKGSFFIDFISSVPFSAFASGAGGATDILDALGLLKLFRMNRLSAAVTRSNMAQDIKVYLKIIMMAFYLVLFIHVLSCCWFAIVAKQERWVQNMDFMYAGAAQAYQGFYEGDENFFRKYLVLIYTGFYIFGVGEIVPRSSNLEFGTAIILCSLCTIFNALIIGLMTSYLEELNKNQVELNDNLNLSNTAMINLELSSDLKSEIT